jgi:fido (protein-threonine AMPylation protein)
MTDLFHADDNATPLTEVERADLIPTHISLRSELNELEQKNIAEAYVWAFRHKRQVIDEAFLKGLHRRRQEFWRRALPNPTRALPNHRRCPLRNPAQELYT